MAHSKLSNTCVSPALVTSIVLSYSLPQTSHWAMASSSNRGRVPSTRDRGRPPFAPASRRRRRFRRRLGGRRLAWGRPGGGRLRFRRRRGGLGVRRRLLLLGGWLRLLAFLLLARVRLLAGVRRLLPVGVSALLAADAQRRAVAALSDRVARDQLGRGEEDDSGDERDRRRRCDDAHGDPATWRPRGLAIDAHGTGGAHLGGIGIGRDVRPGRGLYRGLPGRTGLGRGGLARLRRTRVWNGGAVGRQFLRDPLGRAVEQLAEQRHEDRSDRRGNPGARDPQLRGDGGRRCGRDACYDERAKVEAALLLALTSARGRSHRPHPSE